MKNSNNTLKDTPINEEKLKAKRKPYPTPFPIEHGLSRKEREFNYQNGGY